MPKKSKVSGTKNAKYSKVHGDKKWQKIKSSAVTENCQKIKGPLSLKIKKKINGPWQQINAIKS